ncbi:GNAT family N-acetyltransferase [Vibrio sp.]|uniref:GNAT family N-acetyltransferase n=1 Tax=Vibrio sp. TaxID=678 RepID=UPI003D0AC253
MIQWQCLSFDQLSNQQLYDLLRLRVDVFVVEQTCPYPELDGHDHHPEVMHLLGYQAGQLVACARLLPPGITYPNASIGRIATHLDVRKQKLGHQLVNKALTVAEQQWPESDIEIGAQHHLVAFYQQHGFSITSEMYLEDGIPHIDMIRRRAR